MASRPPSVTATPCDRAHFQKEQAHAGHADFELGVQGAFRAPEPDNGKGNRSSSSSSSSVNRDPVVSHFEAHLAAHPEDPTGKWYRDNASEWAALWHPKWGLALPAGLQLLSGGPPPTASVMQDV